MEYVETWPERDIALLFCPAGEVTVLNMWLQQPVQVLTDVSAIGYPHAVTAEGDRMEVVFRAYKGYVITIRGFELLPSRPPVYEVSCPFPEGLSGAPVLVTAANGQIAVAGVVLGSSIVVYAGERQSVGVAMMAGEIMALKSERLGGRIAERLGFAPAVLEHRR